MTNKNSTAFIFKTYRQSITVIDLTEANFNHGKDCLRATEIKKGHNHTNHKKVFKETHHSSHLHVTI